MKKKFNILTSLVCALSVFNAVPIASYAKNAPEEYSDIISDVSENATHYGFFDLNGDGSDELIVMNESSSSISYSCRVYTVKNSEVQQVNFKISSLKSYDIEDIDECNCTSISINPDNGIIKIDYSGEWDNHVLYCEYADTYSGAVISEIDRIDMSSRTNSPSYLYNGEEIEKSEYTAVQKSYGDDSYKNFTLLGMDYKINDLSPFGMTVTTSKAEKILTTAVSSEISTETTGTAAVSDTVTSAEKIKQFDSSEVFMSWKEAYSAVLRYFEGTDDFSEDTSSWDLYDINGDETPELFISPKSTQDSGVYVYTFANNKCQKLSFPDKNDTSDMAGSWGVVSVIPEKNLLRSYTLKDCVEKNIYYNFLGKTFKSDFVFASNSIEGEYFCNDIAVTPEDYSLAIKPYRAMSEYAVGRKYSFRDISVSFEAYESDLKTVEPETEPETAEEKENKISALKAHLPKFLAAGALIAAGIAVLIPFIKNKRINKKKSSK